MSQLLQPITLHGWSQELFLLVKSISPIFHLFQGLLFLYLEVRNRRQDELVGLGRMLSPTYFAKVSLGRSLRRCFHLKNRDFRPNKGYCKLQIKRSLVHLM